MKYYASAIVRSLYGEFFDKVFLGEVSSANLGCGDHTSSDYHEFTSQMSGSRRYHSGSLDTTCIVNYTWNHTCENRDKMTPAELFTGDEEYQALLPTSGAWTMFQLKQLVGTGRTEETWRRRPYV